MKFCYNVVCAALTLLLTAHLHCTAQRVNTSVPRSRKAVANSYRVFPICWSPLLRESSPIGGVSPERWWTVRRREIRQTSGKKSTWSRPEMLRLCGEEAVSLPGGRVAAHMDKCQRWQRKGSALFPVFLSAFRLHWVCLHCSLYCVLCTVMRTV